MKPNFALSLSFEGIDLLYRAPDGWRAVGSVSFEDPQLSSAITALRAQADDLSPDGVSCKLILPENQVKYLTLPLGNARPADYRTLAERALEGTTPYPLDALEIDWRAANGRLYVAAVAKETLAEAEGFAEEHAFHPVSFTAEAGADYPGEPFFGSTKSAPALLGDAVTPDQEATAVIGPVILAAAVPEPISAPAVAVLEDAPTEGQTAEAADTKATSDYDQLALEIENELSPAVPLSDEEKDLIKAAEGDAPASQPDAAPENGPLVLADDLFAAPKTTTIPPAPADGEGLPDAADLLAPLPADMLDGLPDAPAQNDAAAATAPVEDGAEGLPPIIGAIRRVDTDAAAAATPAPAPIAFASVRSRPAAGSEDDAQRHSAPKLDGVNRGAVFEGVRKLTLRPDTDSPATTGDSQTQAVEAPAPKADFAPDDMLKVGASLTATAPAGADEAEADTPQAAKADVTNTPTEDEAVTAPSPAAIAASGGDTVGGKPRHLGLTLTALLLVGFVVAYGWAWLSEGGDATAPAGEVTVATDTPEGAEVAATPPQNQPLKDRDLPAVDGATLDAAPETKEAADLPPELQYEPEAPAESAQDLSQAAPAEDTAAEEIAISTAERYAASGIWDAAPGRPNTPEAASLDDLYIASIDPSVPAFDAVALPDAGRVRSDITPPAQSLPAAAGTTFSFDQRGLVTATAEGALTPDGILIYLGKPPVRPRNLPERVAEPQADNVAPDTISPAELERRSKVRPQARPENLIETNERSQLGGRTRNELANLRPKLRPANLIPAPAPAPAEEEARLALLNSATQPLVDLSGETRDAIDEAVAESVLATSLKPKARPRNLDTSGSAPVQVASAARSQPQLPSSASVARQATVKNQLNLRKVSLIGISGKSGARNALVRMKNGRIKKVSVGDRLDGGRVTAISDSELRYKRSSRTVVLKMPRG